MMDAAVQPALDLSRLGEIETWQAFAPHLHIGDPGLLPNARFFGLAEQQSAAARAQITQEGHFQICNLNWGLDIARMVETVRALTRAGVSPAFAFIYDEYWIPFRRLDPIIKSLLGPYALVPDFWAWDVDAARGESGWAPHRDRGAVSLFADGSPKSLTVWIPLTPATPLSSCMYVVPRGADPTYATSDEAEHRFLPQGIRALPALPGDVLIWNQAVLHWGSQASTLAAESRISVAAQFQRLDQPPMREPLLDPARVMPFETRLKLIVAQVMGYRNLYAVPPAIEKFALGLIGHLVQ